MFNGSFQRLNVCNTSFYGRVVIFLAQQGDIYLIYAYACPVVNAGISPYQPSRPSLPFQSHQC